MAETRIRIIPDRIFHKMWDGVDSCDNIHEYISEFTDTMSENKINYKKYKIDYIQFCEVLKAIYEMKKKSIAELLNENGIKPIEISHRFCIPIRTIENWMANKRTPPDYLKLFLLETYDIKFLPNFIYTESGNKKRARYIDEAVNNKNREKNERIISKTDEIFSSYNNEEDDEFDFDEIDKKMRAFEERISLREIEKQKSSPKILDSTSYLDNIIRRK